ncbi:MAG: ABC transporter substrate-binding protein [Bacillota bacterium]|nr:MAG: ABC transporter substrate-binding protein [Bacillota bacterium]
MSRREFLRWLAMVTGSTWLAACSPLGHEAPGGGGSPGSPPGSDGDQPVRVGYVPITDACPLLVADALGYYRDEGLTVEQPRPFRSWAQIAEAFQARQVNVIHLLMPAALWLRYARGFPARVVAWNHVNGSALTVHRDVRELADLAGRVVAVPFWYSIHNVMLQLLLRRAGLRPVLGGTGRPRPDEVRLIVMSPPDMVPALAAGQIAGFVVAEPFNALAELQGQGRILRFTGDVWKEHACCVVLLHEEDVQRRRAWAEAVVRAVVRAQLWLRQHREEAAPLLSREGRGYLPQPPEALARVFSPDPEPYLKAGVIEHRDWLPPRIDFQPYPFPSYTAELVRRLADTRVEGDAAFLRSLAPDFAARDLVDEGPVRAALKAVGGPQAFGLPRDLARVEVVEA